jgi:hypothetical protein
MADADAMADNASIEIPKILSVFILLPLKRLPKLPRFLLRTLSISSMVHQNRLPEQSKGFGLHVGNAPGRLFKWSEGGCAC